MNVSEKIRLIEMYAKIIHRTGHVKIDVGPTFVVSARGDVRGIATKGGDTLEEAVDACLEPVRHLAEVEVAHRVKRAEEKLSALLSALSAIQVSEPFTVPGEPGGIDFEAFYK